MQNGFHSKIKTRKANSVNTDETARVTSHLTGSTLLAQVFVLVCRAERVKYSDTLSPLNQLIEQVTEEKKEIR